MNAVIESTYLGFEDHGILTAWLRLKLEDDLYQGFGGYCLDGVEAARFIKGVLQTMDVSDWSQLKGKALRVEHEDGLIVKIGHFIDNKWFSMRSK
jgi:hypothetical protein